VLILKKLKNLVANKKILLPLLIIIAISSFIAAGYVYSTSKVTKSSKSVATNKETLEQFEKENKAINIALSGDTDGAIAYAKADVANATNYKESVEAYNKLANVYMYSKNYNEAINTANKSITILNNANAWVIIGKAYEDQNNYKKAVESYQKAVDLSTESKEDGRGDYVTYNSYLINARAKL
jgi:tetratricopeptide (TPR) repeat protein